MGHCQFCHSVRAAIDVSGVDFQREEDDDISSSSRPMTVSDVDR